MPKFNYKFKTIKEIKERFEKKTQKELAVIDLEIKSKHDEALELKNQLNECRSKKLSSDSKKITDLHFYEKYEGFLSEQIELVQKFIAEKRIERKEKLNELIKKSKETKTFEKIEEQHLIEFIKNQEKIEQKEMDEFAVNGFLKD